MKRLVEYYLLTGVAGIALVCMLYILLLPLPAKKVFATTTVQQVSRHQANIKSGIPLQLKVPSVGIDKSIRQGAFDVSNQAWTLDDTNIFFANASVPANNSNGVTLIYGHATWGVFGILPDLQLGAAAEIHTDSGYVFNYRYTEVKNVVPSDVSVFTNTGHPRLVLQTCTGMWDSHRALYSFELVGVVTS